LLDWRQVTYTRTPFAAEPEVLTMLVFVIVLCTLALQGCSSGSNHPQISGGAGTAGNLDASTNVTHGSQLDETNTGIPAGHSLSNVASTIQVTEQWIADSNSGARVLQDRNFLTGANLIVTVDGFTVQYCKFNGKSGVFLDANDGQTPLGKNVQVLDSEFDGNNANLNGDSPTSATTLKRVHIHRWPRNLMLGVDNIWVEECYMHDLTCDNNGAHIENIYIAGGANLTFIRNKLISNATYLGDGTAQISASLAIYNEDWGDFPNLNYILVQDNYLESDGGYAMYGGACVGKQRPFAKSMTVRGNVFGRGEQRNSGVYGPATAFDRDEPTNRWENNTWGARGPLWQQGDPEEGQPIDAPPPT
jgi:hypothetical protein